MKKIILIVVMLMSSLYASNVKTQTGAFPASKIKSQNKQIVQMAVKEISKKLPQTVDKYTQLVDIQAKDATIVYYFEINTGSKSDESVRKNDKKRMQDAVTRGICQSSKNFLKAQINISYVYISAKTKKELFKFDISKEDCTGI
jgi:hypothetical protein